MHSSFTTMPQPEPDNKFPDCLSMKLEGIPIHRDIPDYLEFLPTSRTQQIELYLTLNFNEQWESLRQGRIKFGLKGGELRLRLEGGQIPYEFRELSGSVELALPSPMPDPDENQPPTGIEDLISATNSVLEETQTDIQAQAGTGEPLPSGEQVQVSVCHVTKKVSEENPAWVFEEERGQPILKGWLNGVKLATLKAIAFPCRVEATFEVSKRDVCLTDAEGLWPPDISRNKRAVLDRLIIQRVLEPKFKPYLSRAQLHYDG